MDRKCSLTTRNEKLDRFVGFVLLVRSGRFVDRRRTLSFDESSNLYATDVRFVEFRFEIRRSNLRIVKNFNVFLRSIVVNRRAWRSSSSVNQREEFR